MIYIRFQTFNYFKTPLPPQNEENVSLNANKWKIKYELIGSNMTTEKGKKRQVERIETDLDWNINIS